MDYGLRSLSWYNLLAIASKLYFLEIEFQAFLDHLFQGNNAISIIYHLLR